MKYLLLLFLSFMSSIVFTQSETNDNSITAKTSFTGRHCRGTHGLCNFDDTAKSIDSNSIISYDELGNSIIIEINRSRISPEEQLHILQANPQNYLPGTQMYYLMEDDFVVPTSISLQLQIYSEDIIIPSGVYPLTISDDTITITFNLE